MKINNQRELGLFEKALDKCRHSILLETYAGSSYDLKTADGHNKGIAELQKDMKCWQEPELFVTNPEDMGVMLSFVNECPAVA